MALSVRANTLPGQGQIEIQHGNLGPTESKHFRDELRSQVTPAPTKLRLAPSANLNDWRFFSPSGTHSSNGDATDQSGNFCPFISLGSR
jgi:hypothetical protein